MTVTVNVTDIKDLHRAAGFYDGIVVVEVDSDLGRLELRVEFEKQPTLDDALKYAFAQVKNFAIAFQNSTATLG